MVAKSLRRGNLAVPELRLPLTIFVPLLSEEFSGLCLTIWDFREVRINAKPPGRVVVFQFMTRSWPVAPSRQFPEMAEICINDAIIRSASFASAAIAAQVSCSLIDGRKLRAVSHAFNTCSQV
jgi:hypothetical protein